MAWVLIDPNKELQPGDRIRLTFYTSNWFWVRASDMALYEWYCSRRPEYELLSIEEQQAGEEYYLIFKIRIRRPEEIPPDLQQAGAFPYTAAVIIAGICAIGIVYSVSIKRTEQFVQTAQESITSPGGQTALTGLGVALPIAAVAILILVLHKSEIV